jgi:hypothetical protein
MSFPFCAALVDWVSGSRLAGRLVSMSKEARVQIVVDAHTWEPLRLATPKEDFKPAIFRWNYGYVRVTFVPASEAVGLPTLKEWRDQRKLQSPAK